MNKTLLIIGAGIEQIPGIKLAKKMGLYVLATDGNPFAPGFKHADDYARVSTYNIKGTVDFASRYNQKKKIDGVVTLASDVPVTVSSVAHELRLSGNTITTAKLASNKLLMKNKFAADGISIPEFCEVKNVQDIKRFIKKNGYPVVIKPIDSRGARGVLRITENIDLEWAFGRSKKESSLGRVMVEKFLDGPQISSESIIYDDNIYTPGLSNRNYEYLERFSPYIIENGGDLPVSLNDSQKKSLDEVLLKAANSIGIKRGSIKGDIVWTRNGPKVIEVAARLSGGWFCTDEIPLSTGVNVVKTVIDMALGIKPNFTELIPKYHRGVALRYIFANKGKITGISGVNVVKGNPNVVKVGINIKPGSIIDEISDHTKRLGYVITRADTREKAIKAAQKAISSIKIHISK
ncbi:MAG: ATP-grasp domain-containing protein [Candidatus Omnitrophota bacterium]